MNLLSEEKSPYLLQHADNPVQWYPWGEKAFARAKEEDKPIFLSIGYATCHWCHVMAHESFEDKEVAEILNRNYIAVKVDREERPDIDHIYMAVCQAMTGGGGWPLSIFMTPEAKPFFAGTYFPRIKRMAMPGFVDILLHIAELWRNDRRTVLEAGQKVTNHLQIQTSSEQSRAGLGENTLKKCFDQLKTGFDEKHGGFSTAPKFPTPHQLLFLLRWYRRSHDPEAVRMVAKTLASMRNGGIYDQIGFGFHRYSVDEKWLVPHFEKMLYDQAMLALAYTEAFQVTGNASFERTAREIFAYVLRDMTHRDGGFYSAEDADSEGREGRFYVWRPKQIKDELGEDLGDLVTRYFGITDEGNFEEGYSIAHVPNEPNRFAEAEGMGLPELETALEEARNRLFLVRKQRIHPLKDDKILTSWNGLMIAAFSKGFQVFGDRTYAEAASAATEFLLTHLRDSRGRLLRRYRQGEASYPGYLDDYAFLVWGLLELYEATFDVDRLEQAVDLNRAMLDIFWDQQGGGLFFTGKGNERLITRTKEAYDGAMPSGNSVSALNLFRLGRMTGNMNLEKKAEEVLQAFAKQVARVPLGYTQLMNALDFSIGPAKEIVMVSRNFNQTTDEFLKIIRKGFDPNKVVLFKHDHAKEHLESISEYTASMSEVNQLPTVYVCKQFSCRSPVTQPGDLATALQ